jgi:hypothetical protein
MHDRAAWRRNFGSLVPLLSIAALADTAAGAFADATGTAIATGAAFATSAYANEAACVSVVDAVQGIKVVCVVVACGPAVSAGTLSCCTFSTCCCRVHHF